VKWSIGEMSRDEDLTDPIVLTSSDVLASKLKASKETRDVISIHDAVCRVVEYIV
jgi:hypothetical protein